MITLRTGQTIRLRQAGVRPLRTVRIDTSWVSRRRRGIFRSRTQSIDLDASAVLFADRQPVDVVFFRHLVSDDGSVRHSGDSFVGDSIGDSESILFDLHRIPLHVDSIVVALNSFTGQVFADVEVVTFRLIDEAGAREVAVHTLAGGGTHTARLLAKLGRQGSDWCMTALGTPASGRTFQELLPTMLQVL
ncbi:TerD family protein [Streptomyces sp. NPDC005728]|uniref:TerD family protein n=1 Tax=Streptomyces sp. NPDC005728 TaxID=3157054 RepID=UPI0033D44AF6